MKRIARVLLSTMFIIPMIFGICLFAPVNASETTLTTSNGGGGAELLDSPNLGENSDIQAPIEDIPNTSTEEVEEQIAYTYKTYEDFFIDYNITKETITEADLTGNGSKATPYNVNSTKGFAYLTNKDNFSSLHSKYININCDIILNDEVFAEDGTPSGGDGVVYNFKMTGWLQNAKIEGNGHTVYGLYFNDETVQYVGLFFNANIASLKNLNMENVWLKGSTDFGAFGYAAKLIENCHLFSGTIYSKGYSGGLLFIGETVKDCTNNGDVIGYGTNSRYFGGIVAIVQSNPVVDNCINYGDVSGHWIIGGITSHLWGVTCDINNCQNYGAMIGYSSSSYAIGGIFGGELIHDRENGFIKITNSKNYGKIHSSYSNGGIIGEYGGVLLVIDRCFNYGEILNYGGAIIGILGNQHIDYANAKVSNCYNEGSDRPFIGGNSTNSSTGTLLTLELKNNYAVSNSTRIFGNINQEYQITIDGFYLKEKAEGDISLLGALNSNGKLVIKNVILESNNNSKDNVIYLSKKANVKLEISVNGLVMNDSHNPENNHYYGTDFSAFYINWKTGKIRLKALDGVGFYQGKVDEEVLIKKGFVKKEVS